MAEVIGVKFRFAGRMYYFGPNGETFERGEKVIVETARGRELGNVVAGNREVPDDDIVQPLKDIIRKATEEDIMSAKDFQEREAEAFRRCKEKIKERGLEMKLVEAEYTYDGSKVIFYFTAEGRVDFRELVKDLASMFKTRIELRQIGIRDEAMIRGGIGSCGRPLCCASYLNDFVPVSIKMAKEQNLSLNPTKISGICGRLMCCLKNEEDTYEFLNSQMPRMGEEVENKALGIKGTVTELSVLKQKVKVRVEDGDNVEIMEFPASELTFKKKKGCPVCESCEEATPESAELAALEALEESEEAARAEEVNEGQPKRDRDRRHKNHGHHHSGQGEGQENQDREQKEESREEGNREHRRHHDNRKNREDRRPKTAPEAEKNQGGREAAGGEAEAGGNPGGGEHRRHRNHHGNRNRNKNKSEAPKAEG